MPSLASRLQGGAAAAILRGRTPPPLNPFATIFVLVNAAAILLLPLRWAALPLLVGACYMSLGEGVEIGGLSFPVIRMLIAVGYLRILLSGTRVAGGWNRLDALMLAWAAWAVATSVFHENVAATAVNRLGLVYNACGIYFLLRVFCRSVEDVFGLCRITAILLIPLALEMGYEMLSGRNLFAFLGGVDELSAVRSGSIRAQGPFAHPILAGSVGATSLPLMFALWRRHRAAAMGGILACLLMVVASASSGPFLSAVLAIAALGMWRWRSLVRPLIWWFFGVYLLLEAVMNAPAYFLLARLGVMGGSTSWHRAELIDAAIRHFPEWWLGGTDYTRHWMAYGVGWSPNHIDITNYYIMMGVYGGIGLVLLFIAVLLRAFSMVGRNLRQAGDAHDETAAPFLVWALGVALFAHAATFMSVSYFDQSVLFLYLVLAAICAASQRSAVAVKLPVARDEPGWKKLLREGRLRPGWPSNS